MFEVPVDVSIPVGQFIFGMVKNLVKWHGLDTILLVIIILDIIIYIALFFKIYQTCQNLFFNIFL